MAREKAPIRKTSPLAPTEDVGTKEWVERALQTETSASSSTKEADTSEASGKTKKARIQATAKTATKRNSAKSAGASDSSQKIKKGDKSAITQNRGDNNRIKNKNKTKHVTNNITNVTNYYGSGTSSPEGVQTTKGNRTPPSEVVPQHQEAAAPSPSATKQEPRTPTKPVQPYTPTASFDNVGYGVPGAPGSTASYKPAVTFEGRDYKITSNPKTSATPSGTDMPQNPVGSAPTAKTKEEIGQEKFEEDIFNATLASGVAPEIAYGPDANKQLLSPAANKKFEGLLNNPEEKAAIEALTNALAAAHAKEASFNTPAKRMFGWLSKKHRNGKKEAIAERSVAYNAWVDRLKQHVDTVYSEADQASFNKKNWSKEGADRPTPEDREWSSIGRQVHVLQRYRGLMMRRLVLSQTRELENKKAELMPPSEKGIFRKGIEAYNRLPKIVKAGGAALLVTGGMAATGGLAGVGSIAAYGAWRTARSLATMYVGAEVAQRVAKGARLLMRSDDFRLKKGETRRDAAIRRISHDAQLSNGLEGIDPRKAFEMYGNAISKERRDDLVALAAGAVAAVGVGAGAGYALHDLDPYVIKNSQPGFFVPPGERATQAVPIPVPPPPEPTPVPPPPAPEVPVEPPPTPPPAPPAEVPPVPQEVPAQPVPPPPVIIPPVPPTPALPIETPPSVSELVKVQPGDTLWGLLEKRFSNDSRFTALDRAQKDYFLDAYSKEMKTWTPDKLKELGFKSGDINKIYPGDTLRLKNMGMDEGYLEKGAFDDAKGLTESERANISEYRQRAEGRLSQVPPVAPPQEVPPPAAPTVRVETPPQSVGGPVIVKPGDTLWGITEKYFSSDPRFTALDRAQKDYFLDTYWKFMEQKYGSAGLKELGFESGNIHSLVPGNKLVIPGLNNSSMLYENTMVEARGLTAPERANISEYRQRAEGRLAEVPPSTEPASSRLNSAEAPQLSSTETYGGLSASQVEGMARTETITTVNKYFGSRSLFSRSDGMAKFGSIGWRDAGAFVRDAKLDPESVARGIKMDASKLREFVQFLEQGARAYEIPLQKNNLNTVLESIIHRGVERTLSTSTSA